MNKFCIFCGREPEAKNKEHVIPLWLIRATGNPNRTARFGVDLTQTPPRLREFAFNALTFPACQKCNEIFGCLEVAAKPILERVLAKAAISAQQFSVLLDWFDKIRVGLWLGYLYLDKNPNGITPSFHIQTRVRQTDRTAIVIHIVDRQQGINFLGPESPCFQSSPTCFALLINEWCFVNISGMAINSRRLGFPYAQPVHFRDDGKIMVSIEPGTQRIMRPVQRDVLFSKATILQQPIFPRSLLSPKVQARFREDWVRCRSIDPENGVGSVFIETPDQVSIYPSHDSRDWIPKATWSLAEVYERIPPFVHARLARDLENAADLCTKQGRRELLRSLALFRQVNEAITAARRRSFPRGSM